MGTGIPLRPSTRQNRRREQNGETAKASPERPPGRPGKDIAVSQNIIANTQSPSHTELTTKPPRP